MMSRDYLLPFLVLPSLSLTLLSLLSPHPYPERWSSRVVVQRRRARAVEKDE
jgi:hypothetical protein